MRGLFWGNANALKLNGWFHHSEYTNSLGIVCCQWMKSMVCELYLHKAHGENAHGEASWTPSFWPAMAEKSQDVSLSREPAGHLRPDPDACKTWDKVLHFSEYVSSSVLWRVRCITRVLCTVPGRWENSDTCRLALLYVK